MADLPCPDPEAEAAPEGSPDLNGLAKVWNDDDTIRTMVLHTKSLLAWPSPKMTGVINFNTMRQNSAVIQTVLGVWCTRVATPQTVYIDHMRDEVAKFRTKLAMPDDPMQVNCDAGSLRCFVTYIVKRHDGARRRDPVVASLFEFVSGYWPVMVRKNSNPACLEDQAHEDETGENGENGEDVNSGVDLEKDADLNDEEIARMLGVVEHECEETALDSLESDVYFAMAEPVEPLRDSQVPNDSLCDDGYFGHPPEKTAPVPESLVPEPSQPELMGPTVDLAEVSPPITPTELEMTPPPAPKTTPASSEPEVVEVLESPPKKKSSLFGDGLTLENIQKKIDSLKAVQQRLQVQQCARPTLGVNVPACFDGGAETLPFDPEPIAEELKRLPSPPKPDLTGVPKKFRKFVVNSEALSCPSSGSSSSKDAPVPDPCEPDSAEANPNPKAVACDPPPNPKLESLFHALDQVTRRDQMNELDRLVQEKAAKKKERETLAEGSKPKKANMKKPASAKAKAESKGKGKGKGKAKCKAKSKAKSKEESKEEECTSDSMAPKDTHEMPEEESEDEPPKRPRRLRRKKTKVVEEEESEEVEIPKAAAESEAEENLGEEGKESENEEGDPCEEGDTPKSRSAKKVAGKAKAVKPNKKGNKVKKGKAAKDTPKTAKSEKPKKSAGEKKPRAQKANKSTFARRARPKNEASGLRWDAMRATFESKVAPKVFHPSSLEEPFWNHCGEHEANTEIEEIADYNIFFEGCIDGFMQLDCVKSDMIPAN